MGKKLVKGVTKTFAPITQMPKIAFDKNTLSNVIKNFTPHGQIAGAAQAAGLTKGNLIDDASKALFGGGGGKGGSGGGGGLPSTGGISETAEKYAGELEKQRLKSAEIGGQLTEQLRQQATGEGPLAGAALKQAQSRNLAQTLAAAQGAGASPLATRQMLQQRGQQGQELAQLGIQERLGAQQALGSQLATQAGTGRADIMAGFDISKTPAVMAQEQAMLAAKLQAEKDAAKKAQQSQMLGGLLSAGSAIGVAALSDENQKMSPEEDRAKREENEKEAKEARRKKFIDTVSSAEAPKNIGEGIASMGKNIAAGIQNGILSDKQQKTTSRQKNESKLPSAASEVNDMMDKLEPKKYQYKNPNMPGAAHGTRYGIVAQDLEKSSLGKTLVKNTEQGKMVDTVQGFGAVLAAQAELNRRLKKLEKKGK